VLAHVTKLNGSSGELSEHVGWLARLMMVGVESSGVVSAEIVPPSASGQAEWALVQRFSTPEQIETWRQSEPRRKLYDEIAPALERKEITVSEAVDANYGNVGNVAVAIVTQVKAGQEDEYVKCEGAFQTAQARSPGYRGVYLQPPTSGRPGVWTTLIRFDTPASLDKWFSSDERKKLLESSDRVVSSTDYQMVDTSFPGWFPSKGDGAKGPPNWKTFMLVLLGLYPIVMLEIRFLMPQLHGVPPALANFLGNVISVALTTWVTMPAFIKAFNSWLFLTDKTPKWTTGAGVAAIICIYAIEIALLWRLL
jgi:antibiotic biosynthesis monooxygenase (ABM) superfamily enzyme